MYTNDPCMIPRFNSLNRDYWFASQAYVFLFFEYRIPLFFHFHFFLNLAAKLRVFSRITK